MNNPDMRNILAGALLMIVAHAMFDLVLELFIFFFEAKSRNLAIVAPVVCVSF